MHPKVKAITEECAALVGCGIDDIIEQDRRRHIAVARNLATWRAYRETAFSVTQIAKQFGRDHSTVCHNNKQIDAMIVAHGSLEAVQAWLPTLRPKPRIDKRAKPRPVKPRMVMLACGAI